MHQTNTYIKTIPQNKNNLAPPITPPSRWSSKYLKKNDLTVREEVSLMDTSNILKKYNTTTNDNNTMSIVVKKDLPSVRD